MTLILLAIPATAAAQVADPPAATTGEATDVERTTATLSGTVDPNGSPTTYRFEYGTTTEYGSFTTPVDAGTGDEPIPAEAALEGLTAGTEYHFRLVATNATTSTNGEDKTFTTQAPARVPSITRTGRVSAAPDSAVVRSNIDPNGDETTYYFEYGRTRSYGQRTPDRTLPAGDAGVDITETLTGLRPFRRYHFRVVATNVAGAARSLNRSLVTARLPTALTLDVDGRTPWGEGIEVFGRVTGVGIKGMPIGLERQDFPFSGPFSSVGTPFPVRADGGGRFRIFVPQLFSTTRLRAVTHTSVQVFSPAATAPVTVRVGVGQRRLGRKRVRIRGTVRPAAPLGRALLQRRTATGRWTYARGGRLRPLGESRSRFSFKVRRTSKPRRYRVRVIARDEGAHYPGNSRSVRVAAAPRRRR